MVMGGSPSPLARVTVSARMEHGAPKSKSKSKHANRTTWRPGCPSPNPGGRPRKALAAAEAVRELVDPHAWVAFELAIATDESQPLDVRRASWHALIDRGFVRAPAQLALEVTGAQTDDAAYEHATPEQLRAAEATLLALKQGTGTPSVTDDNIESVHRLDTKSDEP
jgi:hypothetical protein